MTTSGNKNEALEKARYLCSREEKCRSDIERKLAQWNVKEPDRDNIIEQLIEDKFIDEQRYANAFVRGKMRQNKWGKIKISYHLKMKNIPAEKIEQALITIDEEEYHKLIRDELMKKKHSIRESEPYKLKAKLVRYGLSKGYEQEIIFLYINDK